MALLITAGMYTTFTTIDHWWFFRDGEKSGIANITALNPLGVDDIHCNRDMILVRMEDDAAVYRCPTLFVIGGLYSQPFAPWPEYQEGRSIKLKKTLENVMRDAEKLR